MCGCLGPALVFNLAGELEVNWKSWQVSSRPASSTRPGPMCQHKHSRAYLLRPCCSRRKSTYPTTSGLETRIVELVRYEMTVSGPECVVGNLFHPDPRWVPGTL